jgi:hypothetical protein
LADLETVSNKAKSIEKKAKTDKSLMDTYNAYIKVQNHLES